MTRINLTIPPSELCDQHLLAEYRELPRVFGVSPVGAPALPTLGKGHVKWCATKLRTMAERQADIVSEMKHRGFRANFAAPDASQYTESWSLGEEEAIMWAMRHDMQSRIRARLRTMTRKPTWTNRTPPAWAML